MDDFTCTGKFPTATFSCTRITGSDTDHACGISIGILVISVTTLMVALAGVLVTTYLLRVTRQHGLYRCTCSKGSETSLGHVEDSPRTTSMPSPGLTDDTNRESDNQQHSSPKDEKKKPPKDTARTSSKDKSKKTDGDQAPKRRTNRSKSLPYTKNWLGSRSSRNSDTSTDTPSEKKSKKEKILQNNPTGTALLRNMREINYELRSKSDFKQPESMSPVEDSDPTHDGALDKTAPYVGSVASSFVGDSSSTRTSGAKDAPLYYTLEPTSAESDDRINDEAADGNNERLEMLSLIDDQNGNALHHLDRTLSDAHQNQHHRPSFKLVSSSKRSNSTTGNARSNTWTARELEKQKEKDKTGKDGYEDVETTYLFGSDDVPANPKDIRAAEEDGSYSLLNRSLKDGPEGQGGNSNRVELPGYQKLAVGQEV